MAESGKKIAGCVTLYHPGEELEQNLLSWITHVDSAYAVVNFPLVEELRKLLESLNVVVICEGKNLGLARALNLCVERAQVDSCQALLTMDQDSRFAEGVVATLKQSYFAKEKQNFALLSPTHLCAGECLERSGVEEVPFVMTSGNLLNLGAWENVGPFDEGLFIDMVDHDFCLRARAAGYLVLQDSSLGLHHKLGGTLEKRIGCVKFSPTYHSPLRRYYLTRNTLRICQRYGIRFSGDCFRLVKGTLAILAKALLAEPKRVRNAGMIFLGIVDFLTAYQGEVRPRFRRQR